MKFTPKDVTFDLRDVGSEIIDQLSRDIYTQSEAIVREVVKNAYDSYLGLDSDVFDDEGLERQILITRERDTKGVGRLFIADRGVGQDLQTLKRNAQISISQKPDELDHANGFRGLGSWAVLGAGSRVTITSRKRGSNTVCRLIFHVRTICKKLGPNTTLHDILNDSHCISFAESAAPEGYERHGTIVEIECDGPRSEVGKYEVNRLFPYTEANEPELQQLLLRSCPVPFSTTSLKHDDISAVYNDAGYKTTQVLLDGNPVERRLPDALSEFARHEINVVGKVAAVAWTAEHPSQNGTIADIVNALDPTTKLPTNLDGPSLQLMKLNVPVGKKGVFANAEQARLMNWYIGEVHIVADDIRPDASGQDLRAGTARDAFIAELLAFYDKLNRRARTKSERINFESDLRDGISAVDKLRTNNGKLTEGQRHDLHARIKTCVWKIEESKRVKKVNGTDGPSVLDDPKIDKLRTQARKMIKEEGLWDTFRGTSKPSKGRKKTKPDTSADPGGKSGAAKAGDRVISVQVFQARLGRVIPQLKKAGLDDQQINEVFRILTEDVLCLKTA